MEIQPDAYVWEQVAAEIRRRIEAGEYRPRLPIPAERRMADELGVSIGSVRHAVAVLREEGRLYTVPKKGTFVSPPRVEDGDG